MSVLEIVLQAVKDGCYSCGEEFESISLHERERLIMVQEGIGYDKKISRDAVKVAIDRVIPFLLLVLQKFMNFNFILVTCYHLHLA